MTGLWVRVLAISLVCLIASEAQAQIEYCSLALGRTPDKKLLFNPSTGVADPQTAINQAAAPFFRPGYQYIAGDTAVNGAVAAIIFTHATTGEELQQFYHDSTAYGAIQGILQAIANVHDRRRAPYVAWARCTNSTPLTATDFQQLNWGNNLTSMYPGYAVQQQAFNATNGAFYWVAGGATTPPNPTPMPPNWAGTPVGCWQHYDYLNRFDGVVVKMMPRTRSNGMQDFQGVYVAMSPVHIGAGLQIDKPAMDLHPDTGYGGNYFGSIGYINRQLDQHRLQFYRRHDHLDRSGEQTRKQEHLATRRLSTVVREIMGAM